MSPQQGTVADRILKAVRRAPGCQLDDLEHSCPDLTWKQVFLEIDPLSRTGQVRLTAKGLGVYTVKLRPRKGLAGRNSFRVIMKHSPLSPNPK